MVVADSDEGVGSWFLCFVEREIEGVSSGDG